MRDLRRHRSLGRILLQGVHDTRKRCRSWVWLARCSCDCLQQLLVPAAVATAWPNEWLYHAMAMLTAGCHLHTCILAVVLPVAHASRCPALQRDGCPKIINLGSAKTDLFYERKKYGFRKR